MKWWLTVLIVALAMAATTPVYAGEGFMVEGHLKCEVWTDTNSDGIKQPDEITVVGEAVASAWCPSELFYAEGTGTCPDGSTATGKVPCIRPIVTEKLFVMGLRAQVGSLYLPRDGNVGGGTALTATGSLVLQFPRLMSDNVGLELAAGTGVSYFPGIGDLLSTNVFEAGLLIHNTSDSFQFTVGYRFSAYGDVDQNFSQSHQGFIRAAWEVSNNLYFGPSLYAGWAIVARDSARTEETDLGTLTFRDTKHYEAFAPTITIDLFWRFWK